MSFVVGGGCQGHPHGHTAWPIPFVRVPCLHTNIRVKIEDDIFDSMLTYTALYPVLPVGYTNFDTAQFWARN